jgi:membrane protease YdiL (CAAX protease family)
MLVAVFTVMFALRQATLPVAVTQTSAHSIEENADWARVELFIWVLLVFLNYRMFRLFSSGNYIAVLLEAFVWDMFIIFVACRMMLGSNWEAVRRGLRVPRPNTLALAAAIPIGIVAVISAGEFLFDWTRELSSPALTPPRIVDYIPWSLGWILLPMLLLPALLEEVIFRGLLQPRFVRRFGVVRGILLLTFVFASWHFGLEFVGTRGVGDTLVFWTLCARLAGSVGVCFVTGWLMLKTHSVLPGTVAHGLYNVFAFPSGPRLIGPFISLLFWPGACSLTGQSGWKRMQPYLQKRLRLRIE